MRSAPNRSSDGRVGDAALARPILERCGTPALGGVAVVAGAVQYLDVVGVRRRGRSVAARPTDPWHIGSNTKAITALVLGDLVREGRARWSQPVLDLFPEFRREPGGASPSLGSLVSQTSGLADAGLLDAAWVERAVADPRPLSAQRLSVVEAALGGWRVPRRPRFRYANVNFVLAGAAIERLTGAPWESVVRITVFDALGLRRAGFGAPHPRSPWGHNPEGRSVSPHRLADNPPAMGPAGTIHLSLEDYGGVLVHMLGRGSGLADALRPPPRMRTSYRLGWRYLRHRDWARGPVLAHEGGNTLWHCVALLAPGIDCGIVTVSNQGGRAGAEAASQLALGLVDRFGGGVAKPR